MANVKQIIEVELNQEVLEVALAIAKRQEETINEIENILSSSPVTSNYSIDKLLRIQHAVNNYRRWMDRLNDPQ